LSLANLYDAGITVLHVLDEAPDMDDKIVGYVSSSQWGKIKRRHEDDARNVTVTGKSRGGASAVFEIFLAQVIAVHQFVELPGTDSGL
jgi:hypothetical protein